MLTIEVAANSALGVLTSIMVKMCWLQCVYFTEFIKSARSSGGYKIVRSSALSG